MYDYRRMAPEERRAVAEARQRQGYPWHQPPHPETEHATFRLVSAACFEHAPRLSTPERLGQFEAELLGLFARLGTPCAAWVVQPNHYHALVRIEDFKAFSLELGRLHGRSAYRLNAEDNSRGRKVWFRSQDRCMRSDRHYFTTLNYVHHNPVHHGYVRTWQEWPWSSCHWYLDTVGRDWLVGLWKEYPLRDYGRKWDA
jgi:putative transposase